MLYNLSCTVPLHVLHVQYMPYSKFDRIRFFFCGEEQVETPVGVIPESDERHAHRSCTQTLLSFKSSCHKIGHRHYRQVKQQITAHHPPTQSLSLNCTYSNESFRASAQQRCTQT